MRGDIRAPSAVSTCSSANVSGVGQSAQETYWKISGPFENVPSGFCPAIPTLLGDRAGGVGYLLKHRSPTSVASATTWRAWRAAEWCSTRRSSR